MFSVWGCVCMYMCGVVRRLLLGAGPLFPQWDQGDQMQVLRLKQVVLLPPGPPCQPNIRNSHMNYLCKSVV